MGKKKLDWKGILLGIGVGVIVLIIIAVIISSQNRTPVTITKYICSDGSEVSDSSYCPKEKIIEEDSKNYEQFDIKLDVIRPDEGKGWDDSKLVESPPFSKDLVLKYWDEKTRYSDPIALAIYTEYNKEEIRCEIEEYYGSSKQTIITRDLFIYGYRKFSVIFVQLSFETDIQPKLVKYFVKCMGVESKNTASNTFHLNLDYNKIN